MRAEIIRRYSQMKYCNFGGRWISRREKSSPRLLLTPHFFSPPSLVPSSPPSSFLRLILVSSSSPIISISIHVTLFIDYQHQISISTFPFLPLPVIIPLSEYYPPPSSQWASPPVVLAVQQPLQPRYPQHQHLSTQYLPPPPVVVETRSNPTINPLHHNLPPSQNPTRQ